MSHQHILVMNITTAIATTFPSLALHKFTRRRFEVFEVHNSNRSESNTKKAYLFAKRKERIKLPNYDVDSGGEVYHISEFLSHPSGIEAILNTKALQSFQSVDFNMYRCTLPKIQFLNFEVAPVLDLQVTPTSEECTVAMLSCRFEGSEVVECQNNYFSASMKNHITWDTNDSESYLDIDVELNLTLEIYTRPFSLLPTSAVERPGNLMMQALVDRLVPSLLQQLLQDYDKWVQEKSEDSAYVQSAISTYSSKAEQNCE